MPSRRARTALAAALLVPLLVAPVVASAASAPLRCAAAEQTGSWQRLPVSFRPTEAVRTSNALTAYSVDAARPQRVLVTNGNSIRASSSHGCAFDDVLVLRAQPTAEVPVSGTTSTIVATASLFGGPSLAAVREGTGAASRPHVLRSADDRAGSWAASSGGLPAQGAPRLLEPALDGRTAYLSLSPTTDSGTSGGTLPTLPGGGSEVAGPAGLLYATTDGGRSWALRTTAAALPSGVTGFDALAVDPADPQLVYALSGGRLVVSRDGGRTLSVHPDVAGATAVEPMEPGEVAVLLGAGRLLHSRDAATTFSAKPAPARAASAAYRAGDASLVVEADGRLLRVDARGAGASRLVDAGVPATKGSARGDRAAGGSFHALSGNSLLRYVDPRPVAAPVLPPPVDDLPPPPPPQGEIRPARAAVELPVGSSRLVDLELRLPRSPTPLDVYLLVDTSPTMGDFIVKLKQDLVRFTTEVQDAGIDLRVGLATIGPGPAQGEPPYPDVDPNPDYEKPELYRRLRAIGPVDAQLTAAVRSIEISTPPTRRSNDTQEGQLVGLQEMVEGDGVRTEQSTDVAPVFAVPPGQDAGFRGGVRRVAALLSDDRFEVPYPTPTRPDGSPDVDAIAEVLTAKGVQFIGVDPQQNGRAAPDMREMARRTGTFAPAGGVDCGDEVVVAAGDPLVCEGTGNLGDVLGRLATALGDRQSVALVPRGRTDVLGSVDAAGLRDLDVTRPSAVPFRIRVSCVDLAPGDYTQVLDAVMRDTRVASTTLDVTCTPVAAAAAVPPKPDPPALQEPAPPAAQPVAQAPAAPAPAPPVVQPQVQPQAQAQVQGQAQVQPLTAAALQQQEELQLALALLADEGVAPRNELAMVDRRRAEQLRALALLSVAMAGASAVGVARLRARREQPIRVGTGR